MLKWEEKNLAVQKTLMAEHRASTAKEREEDNRRQERERRPSTHQPKESISHKENAPPKEPKASKRESRAKKVEDEGYGTELYNWNPPTKKKVEVKLVVPEVLKAAMVDDWEAVTKNGQVGHSKRCVITSNLDIARHITAAALRRRLTNGVSRTHMVTGGFKCSFETRRKSPAIFDWYKDILRAVSVSLSSVCPWF